MSDLTPLQATAKKVNDEFGLAAARNLVDSSTLLSAASVLAVRTWLAEVRMTTQAMASMADRMNVIAEWSDYAIVANRWTQAIRAVQE